jgi:hypothetical protein
MEESTLGNKINSFDPTASFDNFDFLKQIVEKHSEASFMLQGNGD